MKHEAEPNCGSGSYEVRFSDGRKSVLFYWDDIARHRSQPKIFTGMQAFQQARALARVERDKSK